jgi:hypothetical protein
MSWLTFVLIAAGVALAAVGLAAFLLGRVDGRTLGGAAAAVVVVGGIATAIPLTRNSLEAINDVRLANRGTPPNQAKEKCLVDGGGGYLVPLVRAARTAMPAKAHYAVIGPAGTDNACYATNMLPRLMVVDVRGGDWVLFTNGVPREWRGRLVPPSVRPAGGKFWVGEVR